MNTRNAYQIRHLRRGGNSLNRAPVGLGQKKVIPLNPETVNTSELEVKPLPLETDIGSSVVCDTLPERSCRHPLTNAKQNAHLARCEESIKFRFDRIIPVLKVLSNLQHDDNFVDKANQITNDKLGFEFPSSLLDSSWVRGLDMGKLYSTGIFKGLNSSVAQFSDDLGRQVSDIQDAKSFYLDCGYHNVDITPCSDGRLKGLGKYILRLPLSSMTVRDSHAGALLNVESNLRHWERAELKHIKKNQSLSNSNYLKILVYHRSSSDPSHQGCAAHGSNDKLAAEKGLERLNDLRGAIFNTHEALIDILLIGVDTDNDSIRIHTPDSKGNLNVHRYIDSAEFYNSTLNLSEQDARLKIFTAIDQCSDSSGWAQGEGRPSEGMRKFIANLLEFNLSQIEYVADMYGGTYPDVGHAERYISVGDGFQEVQLRNIAYYAHLDTVEEGAADLDIGIKIFTGLNLKRGLPIPIAVHYRYDSKVPNSKERTIEKCHRVKEAIINRYKELAANNNIVFQLSVQDLPLGSALEVINEEAS
jgi:carboxysome shell carbonic anhydrase